VFTFSSIISIRRLSQARAAPFSLALHARTTQLTLRFVRVYDHSRTNRFHYRHTCIWSVGRGVSFYHPSLFLHEANSICVTLNSANSFALLTAEIFVRLRHPLSPSSFKIILAGTSRLLRRDLGSIGCHAPPLRASSGNNNGPTVRPHIHASSRRHLENCRPSGRDRLVEFNMGCQTR
jgi:hypothetical protein